MFGANWNDVNDSHPELYWIAGSAESIRRSDWPSEMLADGAYWIWSTQKVCWFKAEKFTSKESKWGPSSNCPGPQRIQLFAFIDDGVNDPMLILSTKHSQIAGGDWVADARFVP